MTIEFPLQAMHGRSQEGCGMFFLSEFEDSQTDMKEDLVQEAAIVAYKKVIYKKRMRSGLMYLQLVM